MKITSIKVLIVLLLPLISLSRSGASEAYEITHFRYYQGGECVSKASNRFALKQNEDCCVFSYVVRIDSNYQKVWVASDETYLMDMETGTRYAMRSILCDAKPNVPNIVKDQKGKYLVFELEFPRLAHTTKEICIYGIPTVGLMGNNSFSLEELQPTEIYDINDYPYLYCTPLTAYDDVKPHLRIPKLVKQPAHYDEDDQTTFPIYTDAPTIYPIAPEILHKNRLAVWCTKDTTYVTQILECKRRLNPFAISPNTALEIRDEDWWQQDNYKPKSLKILSAEVYPIGKNFLIKGTPGDFVPILMKFPPLPVGTNGLSIEMDDYELFPEEWLVPCDDGSFYYQWYIGYLRNNQQYVKPYPDNGGKIIR